MQKEAQIRENWWKILTKDISHSCQTDICRTVRRFSRLLLHNRVMSDKNNFFTSSRSGLDLDWRISEATTFKITEKKQKKRLKRISVPMAVEKKHNVNIFLILDML